MSAADLPRHYLEEVVRNFRKLKEQGEGALDQVEERDVGRGLDDGGESNSIAILVQHLRGNMLSRWTDFLTTDGEKPDRDRDSEFVTARTPTREELRRLWEEGWQCLFRALDSLGPEDLGRRVIIRGRPHTVVQAINRQLTHYAGHVGQIVFLAKHFKAGSWRSLSVPRGQSAGYNRDPGRG